MNISPVYQQARQQAVQEGRQEGQRIFVEHLLKSRFGKLDKPLSNVIDGVIQLPPEEVAPLLLQASREELVAKFNGRRLRKK
jgi:hypothetical protein